MKSDKDIELRIANFTEEEADQYDSIQKLRCLLSTLISELDPDNPNSSGESYSSYEVFKEVSKAFDLSQKIFHTMQEGLYDPKES